MTFANFVLFVAAAVVPLCLIALVRPLPVLRTPRHALAAAAGLMWLVLLTL